MDAQKILDIAFREAKKAAGAKKTRVKGEAKFIELDLIKMETAYAKILSYLNEYITKSSAELNDFEKSLMETLVDIPGKNRQAEKIKSTIRIMKRLKNEYEMKIKYAEHRKHSNKERTAFYGRICSLVKKLKFDKIESFEKEQGRIPKLKKMDTIIIAGYPNVGKSQILKTMSGRRVETAPYPFTTKELLIGYVKNRYADVQVIDTPGVLDRPIEKRNEIEKKAMAAMKHLSKNILFVIDPSETCGYKLEDQLKLKKEVERTFKPKIYTVATKKDLIEKDADADEYVNATNAEDVDALRMKMMKFFF